jgi:hypothetical protein
MLIEITPDGYLARSEDKPIVGRVYNLEDAKHGTGAQNRAFHALIGEYWRSGQHSYTAKNFADFRNQIKRHLGAGFEAFVYATIDDGKPVIHDAATFDEIPAAVRHDPDLKKLVRGRLKSWADYRKKERIDTLNNLISEMLQAGVNTKKFYEIMHGMEDKANEAAERTTEI